MRDFCRVRHLSDEDTRSTLHHFYKYHDPDSEFYLGEKCVRCEFADIQRDIKRLSATPALTPSMDSAASSARGRGNRQ